LSAYSDSGENWVKEMDTSHEDYRLIFILYIRCILCEVQAEAEETIHDPNRTIKYIFVCVCTCVCVGGLCVCMYVYLSVQNVLLACMR
jgi:hypothetical protein